MLVSRLHEILTCSFQCYALILEMGQPDVTTLRLRSIFSSSLLIQIAMGLVIAMLLGTFGVWFVEYKMVIPAERLDVALYVLGFSTLNFFINLLSVPYNALIIAHEPMKAFAYIFEIGGSLFAGNFPS